MGRSDEVGCQRSPPHDSVRPETLLFTADDFGLTESVNEAVERAHRYGVLTDASLMVAAPAAADAVARARRLPDLRVGLHVVAVEGPAVLPPAEIPALVDATGQFPADQIRLALRYAFDRAARGQLAREIAAQFDAFAATGLRPNHADAHKHMHLHPVVGHFLVREAARRGFARIRVPREPGGGALALWSGTLRRTVRRAGLSCTDAVYGIRDSGHMDTAALLRILAELPRGSVEIYGHPATRRDATLTRLMPGYAHEAELAALLNPAVAAATAAARARRTGSPATSRPG